MIQTEYYMTRTDGVVLNRTYSDIGMMIERDGIRYSEAIDPAELGRTYIETDEPIDPVDEEVEINESIEVVEEESEIVEPS